MPKYFDISTVVKLAKELRNNNDALDCKKILTYGKIRKNAEKFNLVSITDESVSLFLLNESFTKVSIFSGKNVVVCGSFVKKNNYIYFDIDEIFDVGNDIGNINTISSLVSDLEMSDGKFDVNTRLLGDAKQLLKPGNWSLICKVVIICPADSDAQIDIDKVKDHQRIKDNKVSYGVKHVKFRDVEALQHAIIEVAQDANKIASSNAKARNVVMAITRGGGAIPDLAVFNSPEIVKALLSCPSNVVRMTAIGHARNFSLSDALADYVCQTPTELRDTLNYILDIDLKLYQNVIGKDQRIQSLHHENRALKSAVSGRQTKTGFLSYLILFALGLGAGYLLHDMLPKGLF